VPEHGDLVAQREGVLEIMAYIDDRKAAGAQAPDLDKQRFALRRRQRSRWLVKYNQATVSSYSSRDFKQLLAGRAQIPDRPTRVDVHSKISKQATRALCPHGTGKGCPSRPKMSK